MAEISNHQIYRKKSQSKHVSRFSFHFLLLFLSFFFLRNFLFFCFYCKTKKMKKKKRKNLSVFALSRFLFKYAKMVAARCANQQTHTHKTDYAQIKTAYSGSSIDQCVCVCVYIQIYSSYKSNRSKVTQNQFYFRWEFFFWMETLCFSIRLLCSKFSFTLLWLCILQYKKKKQNEHHGQMEWKMHHQHINSIMLQISCRKTIGHTHTAHV